MENLNNPTGPPGHNPKANINHVTNNKNISEARTMHKPNSQSDPPTREHPKTYSDVIKTGLQAKHSHMDVVAFEAIWLKAKRPPISNNNFPY